MARVNYQPKVAQKICDEIAQGRPLREICEAPDMPTREAVRLWHAKHPEFRAEYDAARLLAVDLIADDINELADSADDVVRAAAAAGVNESAAITGLRVRIDTKKWLLSKLAPQRYGDRLATEVSGPGGAPFVPETDPTRLAVALHALLAGAAGVSTEGPIVDHQPQQAMPAPAGTTPRSSDDPEPPPDNVLVPLNLASDPHALARLLRRGRR